MQRNTQNNQPGALNVPFDTKTGHVDPYFFNVTPPIGEEHLENPWDADPTPDLLRPRSYISDVGPRYRNRTSSVFEVSTETMPTTSGGDLHRSASERIFPGGPRYRTTKSDQGPMLNRLHRDLSTASFATEGSYYDHSYFPADSTADLQFSRELSDLSLDSSEGIRRFQAGELAEAEQQWHLLVPPEAREALGKTEVQRQSVLFEVFTSERGYVNDMQAVEEVFIEPLRNASPPVIPTDRLSGFITDVFWNMDRILARHKRMLSELFERQRDQHPLIQSIADIVLDALLGFREDYESYIKHYPIAEAKHRNEMKRNPHYAAFVQNCINDPRIRKRDLVTFLSRPVSRLPRFGLLLEHILKLTDADHPDIETLPLILSILSEFIKSTQPGIAVSESKVKFWDLCESLVYVKGEIIDMDLYEESRSLIHLGPLARRQKSEMDWHGWTDLVAALLDNYLILTREETRPNGTVKRHLVSRPLPLEYVQLGAFDGPSESRRERAEEGGLLESLRHHTKPMFPFTVYHESSKLNRRYTLYCATEAGRKKWHEYLIDTIAIHKIRSESNMFYEPRVLTGKFFRVPPTRVPANSGVSFTGKIATAVLFNWGGKSLIAVGCSSGVFVANRGEENFRRVLTLSNPTSMIALAKFNKFIIHHESSLLSYSIDILARVAQGSAPPQALDTSLEKIAGQDGNVLFFKAGRVGNRTLIIYAAKSFLQITLQALEALDPTDLQLSPTRSSTSPSGLKSFRAFGSPFYVPKDAYDVTPLAKTIAISTEKGLAIVDPTNLTKSIVTVVPDFSSANVNPAVAQLKTRCESARALGLVRCHSSELLVVYDTLGCYIHKHGEPGRAAGYIRWEAKATAFAQRGAHVLLFSPQFIEVRHVNTGRLDQVIEATDLRLLHSGPLNNAILAVMKGDVDDRDGASEKVVELQETSALSPGVSSPDREILWDHWDMS